MWAAMTWILEKKMVVQQPMTFCQVQGFCGMLSVYGLCMHEKGDTSVGLRVACYAAMQLAPGCIGLIAPDCRSWGAPARGTTWRNWINPMGVGWDFVMDGNKMASRNLGVSRNMHACMRDANCSCMHVVMCRLVRHI